MSLKNLHSLPDSYLRAQLQFCGSNIPSINRRGHAHFCATCCAFTARISRMTAAASGLLFGGLSHHQWRRRLERFQHPQADPGRHSASWPGNEIFHIFLPAPVSSLPQSPTLTATSASPNVGGMGTQTDTNTNTSKRVAFDVDVRFMRGVYAGEDGRVHRNAFVFV